MKKNNLNHWIIVGTIGFFACAGQQPPIAAMTKASIAVKKAEETKAPQAAPLEMRIAHEKLEQAQKDMEQKNYTSARKNAEDATVQAELAESKTSLSETKSKTTDAEQGYKSMESEIQHSNERSTNE